MDGAVDEELVQLTADALLVDAELVELLALADQGDSWADWLPCQGSSSSAESEASAETDAESVNTAGGFETEDTLKPTPADSGLERRRRQKRESMARCRSQRRETVESLTHQEAALHRILQRILAHKKPIHVYGEAPSPLQAYQARMIELVRAREMLNMERQRLSEELADRSQRTLALQQLAMPRSLDDPGVAVKLMAESPDETHTTPAESKAGRWLQFLKQESPLFYEMLDAKTCAMIIDRSLRALDKIHQSLTSPSRVLFTTHCLGWTVERTREVDLVNGRPRLRMRAVKQIPRARATLQELQDRTWKYMSNPVIVEQANDGNISAVVAQQVDDDTVVILRSAPYDADEKLLRCFRMNTRMWSTLGDGPALVVMVVLDKEAQPREPLAGGRRIKWMKHGFSSVRFSHEGRDLTQIEYTGSFECVSDEHAASLLLANCIMIYKWETYAAPSQLLSW